MTKNQLNFIIENFGFSKVSPSEDLLHRLGLSRPRFFQILNNEGKKELTISEKQNLENWLSEITGKTAEEIDLLGTGQSKKEQELAKELRLS